MSIKYKNMFALPEFIEGESVAADAGGLFSKTSSLFSSSNISNLFNIVSNIGESAFKAITSVDGLIITAVSSGLIALINLKKK